MNVYRSAFKSSAVPARFVAGMRRAPLSTSTWGLAQRVAARSAGASTPARFASLGARTFSGSAVRMGSGTCKSLLLLFRRGTRPAE